MGFRLRKSIKVLPGVRLNLSRRGVSASAGVRGASVNVGSRGVRGTVGVPGTGVSYTTSTGSTAGRKSTGRSSGSAGMRDDGLLTDLLTDENSHNGKLLRDMSPDELMAAIEPPLGERIGNYFGAFFRVFPWWVVAGVTLILGSCAWSFLK